jgi:hypothetical protein
MLLLARGKYVVTFGPTLSAATMNFGVEELCGPAYARVQRWEELIQAGLSLEAVWSIDFAALEMALPGLQQEVATLAHAFDGKRTVREVLMKSPTDELLALEAVGRLIGMGVFVPQDGGSDAAQGASRVRALFQPPPSADQSGEPLEKASLSEGAAGEEPPRTNLYESTGTLDTSVLQQLAAFRIRPVVENVETVPASPELTTFVRHVEPPAPPEQKEERVEESIAGAIEAAIGEIAAHAPEPRGEQEELASLGRALDAELAGEAVEAEADDRPEARWFEESAAEKPVLAAVAPEPEPKAAPAVDAPALEESAPVLPPLAAEAARSSVAAAASALGEGAPVASPLAAEAESSSLVAEARTIEESAPVAPPLPTVVVSSSLAAEARALEESAPVAPPLPTVVVSPTLVAEARALQESAPPVSPASPSKLKEREPTALPRTVRVRPAVAAEPPRLEAEPQPAPDRKWLLVGVVSTALVALLAAAAVVVATRSPDWITSRVFPLASLRSGSQPAVAPARVAKKVEQLAPARIQPPAATVTAAAVATGPEAAIAASAATTTSAAAIEAPAAAGGSTASSASPAARADDGSAALARGVRLYEAGRQREAIRVLETVTRDHPMIASGWVYLGMAKFDRNDRTGAQRAAKKALELDPRNGRALMLLATVYLDTGESQKARTHLRRYLELYPNGQFAREARQLLGRR